MLSIILIVIGAFFNAIMDAVENENFFESIFKNCNKQFWYKRESWKTSVEFFNYKFDAWHISKSLLILSLISSMLVYKPILGFMYDLCLFGIVWNISFIFFYHKVFQVK